MQPAAACEAPLLLGQRANRGPPPACPTLASTHDAQSCPAPTNACSTPLAVNTMWADTMPRGQAGGPSGGTTIAPARQPAINCGGTTRNEQSWSGVFFEASIQNPFPWWRIPPPSCHAPHYSAGTHLHYTQQRGAAGSYIQGGCRGWSHCGGVSVSSGHRDSLAWLQGGEAGSGDQVSGWRQEQRRRHQGWAPGQPPPQALARSKAQSPRLPGDTSGAALPKASPKPKTCASAHRPKTAETQG